MILLGADTCMMKYSPDRRLEHGLGAHVHTGILPEKEMTEKRLQDTVV